MADEEKKTEEESLLDKAVKAAQSLKIENDRAEEIVKRMERLKSAEMLGGHSLAGQTPPQKSNDEAQREKINAKLKSTGLKI